VCLPKLGAAAESDEQTLLYHPEATLLAISSHSPAPHPLPSIHRPIFAFPAILVFMQSVCTLQLQWDTLFSPTDFEDKFKRCSSRGKKMCTDMQRPQAQLLSQSHKHSVSVMLFGSDMLGEIKC